MQRFWRRPCAAALALVALAVCPAPPGVAAPQGGAPAGPSAGRQRAAEPSTDEIIRRFAAAESAQRTARNQYMFKQDVTIQQLMNGSDVVTGTYRRVSEIVFDDQSHRVEKITYFPVATLTQFSVSAEDLQDLGIVQPFALTTEDLPKYTIIPRGKERIDELDTYVFDVVPKDPAGMAKRSERYFMGRVWVDDRDLVIVKVAGQAGPETKDQRFPHFQTYRENIDGKYWFPTYTYADDVLQFPNQDVHMRMIVRYTDYRQFTGNITIEGEEGPDTSQPPAPTKP